MLFSRTGPLFWAGFLAGLGITTSWHQGAKDEWAAVAEALKNGRPKVTNHL